MMSARYVIRDGIVFDATFVGDKNRQPHKRQVSKLNSGVVSFLRGLVVLVGLTSFIFSIVMLLNGTEMDHVVMSGKALTSQEYTKRLWDLFLGCLIFAVGIIGFFVQVPRYSSRTPFPELTRNTTSFSDMDLDTSGRHKTGGYDV